jgi:hypothetical protein
MAERTCAMVVVGNEILSGKVQDSNAYFAARELRKLGVELRRIAYLHLDQVLSLIAGRSKKGGEAPRKAPLLTSPLKSHLSERMCISLQVETGRTYSERPRRRSRPGLQTESPRFNRVRWLRTEWRTRRKHWKSRSSTSARCSRQRTH